MLVHLLARPLTATSHVPSSGLRLLGDGLRASGVAVQHDTLAFPVQDLASSVGRIALELEQAWQRRPVDLVHTFGVAATMAAVRARCPVPIVATFDESPVRADVERSLARHVSALIPLSAAENASARAQGTRALWNGPFPVPMPTPDREACADPRGYVVTGASGADLDELVASMRHWSGTLMVLTRLDASRGAEVRQLAESLGVARRVTLRPGLRGPARDRMWSQAALLVAGEEGSRHAGFVLEAAAHGVPALAVAAGAHGDVIIPGTTGLMIPPMGAWNLGHAIAGTLADDFTLRAMGTAAVVRMRTGHSAEVAGERLVRLYEQALTGAAHSAPTDEVTLPDRAERDALALEHLPLARQLAGWYAGRGQSRDDLVQVASLGLVRAAERFDPAYGREFRSFAIPTILGELRKHFRDNAWAVRVPRGLQETTLHVQRAIEQLRQSTGRDPSATQIAEQLGIVEEEVVLAMQAGEEARSSHSLDHPLGDDDSVASLLGDLDPALDAVELRRDVRLVLAQLPEREKQIILLRFFGERTQAEIAEQLGISQVHVSRILSRTLVAIRDHVLCDVPLPRAWEREREARLATLPRIPLPRQAS